MITPGTTRRRENCQRRKRNTGLNRGVAYGPSSPLKRGKGCGRRRIYEVRRYTGNDTDCEVFKEALNAATDEVRTSKTVSRNRQKSIGKPFLCANPVLITDYFLMNVAFSGLKFPSLAFYQVGHIFYTLFPSSYRVFVLHVLMLCASFLCTPFSLSFSLIL